jgi:hypothetical protein
MRSLVLIGGITHLLRNAAASLDLGRIEDDGDLTSFVSRPEIRVPIYDVQNHHPERITPGYWFVAPYGELGDSIQSMSYLQPCQTGPVIYDGAGELVWAGACFVRNRVTLDFRAWKFNETYFLSGIHMDSQPFKDPKGHGILLDNSYNMVRTVEVPANIEKLDMHELYLFDEGRKVTFLLSDTINTDLSDLKIDGLDVGEIATSESYEKANR